MKSKKTLTHMTRKEKISLLSGSGTYSTKAFPKHGIPSIFICDGPHGIRKRVGTKHTENLIHESAVSVCYPTLSTLANSWDVSLLQQVGEAVGTDAQAKDVQIVLGPGVNIKRNPLCGRNFEYFSEDPLLSGKLGAAWIRGLQSKGVGASVKHYCCNNQETNRMTVSSELDERTLREIYLKPFEIAVKESAPVSLMCSYNRINSVYASDDVRLMNDILRSEWGYRGLTLTDWAAMNDRVAAIRARLTLEMPDSLGYFDDSVQKALADGNLSENDLDACLSPMLEAALDLHNKWQPQPESSERQHSFARVAAAQSAVLLKNDGTLPLQMRARVCVVGPFAKQTRYQGTGSSRVNAYRVDALLDALEESGIDCSYAEGFSLDCLAKPALLQEALKAASKCDVILLALGLPETYESEGFDRDHMNLPQVQDDLVMQISQLGKPITVVLYSGGAVETPWADAVDALLYMGLNGEASGGACADVLLGRVNPSGKLAESWPIRYQDHITSSFWLENPLQAFYREGLFVGYRYFDTVQTPVRFAFGHGMSYTSFEYSATNVAETTNGFDISLTIRNTGDKPGAEVVQLYLHAVNGHVVKPAQELKAFAKIALNAGESRQVTFRLEHAAFSHFEILANCWKTENGLYEIRVGASSRDIRQTRQVTVAYGTDFPETDMGWYSSRKGIPAIADLERLCGHAIARRVPYRRGTYDAGATLGEMAEDSWLARVILAAGRNTIAKGLGIKPDDANPEFRMMAATASASPLRSLALSAPRAMTKGLIRFILFTANKGIFHK